MLSVGFVLETIFEVILPRIKAEKAYTHAALFDEMKKVLRYLFSPHDAAFEFHLHVGNFEFNSDLGVGRADIRCLDEHAGNRDVLGKCHPVCLLNAKTHRETLFVPLYVPFIISHLDVPPLHDKLFHKCIDHMWDVRNIPYSIISGSDLAKKE